jgi:hypothetical protein
MIQRINYIKSGFFEKRSKIDKLFTKLTKRKRQMTQINEIRDIKGKP